MSRKYRHLSIEYREPQRPKVGDMCRLADRTANNTSSVTVRTPTTALTPTCRFRVCPARSFESCILSRQGDKNFTDTRPGSDSRTRRCKRATPTGAWPWFSPGRGHTAVEDGPCQLCAARKITHNNIRSTRRPSFSARLPTPTYPCTTLSRCGPCACIYVAFIVLCVFPRNCYVHVHDDKNAPYNFVRVSVNVRPFYHCFIVSL